MLYDLYNEISNACCIITVFLGAEKISQGTGFSFLATGEIMTAAHVVTGRYPIRQRDANDPELKIFTKFPSYPVTEYKVGLCCITIKVPGFLEDVQIDMAILAPMTKATEFPHIRVQTAPPKLGEEVFIAGYSDELKLPFDVDKLLDKKITGATDFINAMNNGYMADMTGPLIKRAVVGNCRRIFAANKSAKIECDVFYVDNGMHYGASGGPVINAKGEAVGVITQRAVTSASQEKAPGIYVPSGSTVCIGFNPLLTIAERI
ncbi:S1 family peptidase [Geobacter anodireducens]